MGHPAPQNRESLRSPGKTSRDDLSYKTKSKAKELCHGMTRFHAFASLTERPRRNKSLAMIMR